MLTALPLTASIRLQPHTDDAIQCLLHSLPCCHYDICLQGGRVVCRVMADKIREVSLLLPGSGRACRLQMTWSTSAALLAWL